MTLREAQAAVDRWIAASGGGYWPPLANLARLSEEVGELARELNHRFGPKRKKPGEPPGDPAEELGDVLFVLLCLANGLGVDLEQALRRVLDKYRERDADRWQPGAGGAHGPSPSGGR